MPHLPVNVDKGLVVKIPNSDGYILIEKNVMLKMRQYKQDTHEKQESGGCILGFYRDPHIHITSITTPKSGDKKGKYYFKRRDQFHIDEVKIFNKINTFGYYLGEWHSHPESKPMPSNLDLKEWRLIANLDENLTKCFIILGNDYILVESYNV